jgi:DNA polymerase-3 subunit alpha
MELPWVPPCVNRSGATFKVMDGALVYALGALKNVGVEAMKLITEGRKVEGVDKPFSTLFDLARRVDLKRVGKRPLEMLARSGAFDALDPNRRRVFQALDPLVNYSAAIHEQKASNQVSLFGEAGDDLPEPRMIPCDDWEAAERLTEEFKAVGFYLSGHPLDDYMGPLKRKWASDAGVPFMTLDELTEKVSTRGAMNARLAGVVAGRQERKSARGNRFAFAQMSDPSGAYEVTLFSDTLETARAHLETGSQVVVTVEATMESDQLKLLGRSVMPIETAVEDVSSMGLRVFIEAPHAIAAVSDVLEGARRAAKSAGRGPVQLCLMDPSLPGEVEVDLGMEFPVTPQIKGAIRSLAGVLEVEEI